MVAHHLLELIAEERRRYHGDLAPPPPAQRSSAHPYEPDPIVNAPLRPLMRRGATPPPPTPAPMPTPSVRNLVKHTLTKRSRTDLNTRMVEMSSLSGWQSTTLNDRMPTEQKLDILATHYATVRSSSDLGDDDEQVLYEDLLAMAAAVMGWAQSIQRRRWRHERRARRKAERKERKARKRARKHEAGDHGKCDHG